MGVYTGHITSPNTGGVIVNEAYFGKSKELLEIEKQIGVLRKKFGKSYNGMDSKTYFGDWNGDPEMLKLNRMFEKAFGFNCFSMVLVRSSLINAFTIPVGVKWDTGGAFNPDKLKSIAIVDKQGLKFDKNNNLCIICNMYTGLFFNYQFTDGEILGIILHELGHNFAGALDPKIAWNSMALTWLQIILDILNWFNGAFTLNSISPQMFNVLGKMTSQLREIMYQNCKPLITIYNIIGGLMGILKDLGANLMAFNYYLNPFAGIGQKIISGITNLIIKPTGYRDEKIADRFATMYGYGPELTSGLSKMEDSAGGIAGKQAIDDAYPLLGSLLNFMPCCVQLVLGAFDPHPIWSERLEDQIRALEYELKKSDVDPKMKKVIESQIKDIRAQKAKILKESQKNTMFDDANFMKKAWFSMFVDGDQRHEMLGDLNKDLDRVVNQLRIKEGVELLGIGERRFDFI